MVRGYSLSQDLKLLVNNPKYSDIEILCKDETKLYGCRAILASRSEVLEGLLYNGMKESFERQISFPTINSSGMIIILEYIYVGSIKINSLTKDNIIEAYYAADYFQLLDLQEFIMKTIKNFFKNNFTKNYSPELLSKVVEIMPLSEDNTLLNLLIKEIATILLSDIEIGRLSITALQYLLFYTNEKDIPFATPEYEVFRYSAIFAAKNVSDVTYKTLMEKLPTLEQIDNLIQIENKLITDHQKVAKELESLIEYIDFRRIKRSQFDFIEPLKIIPAEIIQHNSELINSDLDNIRGIPIYRIKESELFWDKSACGSGLIIENNGKVVQASRFINHQSVRGTIAFENKGIFEWDIIIEKNCSWSWVGVCATDDFYYESFAGSQATGWVLGSGGNCSSVSGFYYCPSFHEDGAKITVHLDMNERTCAFTVNGTKYLEVLEWNNLPSKLYPVVSLCYPGRFRIQSHQKNENI
ncbi:uncharacterized protein OCT59_000975 [Rhizophagus irregularis]|uniref:Btb/poz domain containing protein n=2 Tax=Rhizophagus irregularis TaxID=588596 RepID=A0A015IDR5_RHIIW|nr:hypothetical protein GLOIN_2v1788445 [Rhizophagus irregularis DAOM 181602=DAOM 197198]EXX55262.1 hypothetical protein RirG_226980 [Rhizophagus irregularis DAOM 197198w]POG59996.1 hypothetical protein GLOIN_2v1788445 [Rhizophagus irregularis DAOM 181602=DAOM 197198]UZN99708.1 hypothetical protein OCT59_000975 [Rhizophagus irregularis]CAG8594125.1 4039_t:CDS:1 [Rhizophagus irregularis]|eukprot:XP_025166862.1 hypothetical protein GLOIN_2v1788445 [Rhizophagus irregularis DAOM 181602=DAOM 197198]